MIPRFNSAPAVRKGEELEHYHPEAEGAGSGGGGEPHHAQADQLAPPVVV